jgi:phosphatidylglycerol---prolipoprotein diacylglyceryl transferase
LIPYITTEDLPQLPISTFALLVLIGLFAGTAWCVWRGRSQNIGMWEVIEMTLWTAIPAYLGSHIFDALVYFPEKVIADPSYLLRFGQGLSAFGGLLTGTVAYTLYLKVTGNLSQWMARTDIIIQGFIVTWIFGRMGCSVVHDHPGILSDFFLAVNYPGGARHDLGFYELLYTLIVLLPTSIWIHHRKLPHGSQLIAFCILYAVYRWPSDYLRTIDIRYASWTPGQYASVVLLLLAYFIYKWQQKTLSSKAITTKNE